MNPYVSKTRYEQWIEKADAHEEEVTSELNGNYPDIAHAILSMGYRIAAAIERASDYSSCES